MIHKKNPSNKKQDTTGRQFGTILEDIDGKLDRVVESQEGLGVRVDKLEGELSNFREETKNSFKSAFDFQKETRNNFGSVFEFQKDTRSNFKSVFEYLSRIDEELISIRKEIVDLRKSLSAKADLDRLQVLEGRVQTLEVQLAKYKIIED